MRVETVHVLATEATRRASNGADLVEAIRASTGLETRVLTGQEEATYAALGVISGFFQPKGLAGDLGGGSLEVAEILGDRVGERMVSMPLGALPVKAMMADGLDAAKKRIDAILDASLPPLLTDPVFYAIGGGWRALARVHIAMNQVPISVVHGYEVAAEDVRGLAKKIARMAPAEVAALPDVPSRRIDTLPAAALVLYRVLRKLKPERVVFSVFGLREGWLYAQLDREEQYRDPLLEGAQSIGLPTARVPEFSAALARWTDDLFPGETPERPAPPARGLRPDRHGVAGPREGPGASRASAACCSSRSSASRTPNGRFSPSPSWPATAATSTRRCGRRRGTCSARASSGAPRSSAGCCCSATASRPAFPEILDQVRVRIGANAVRLEVLSSERVPDSDAVQARLRQLARVSGVEGAEIVQVGG